MDKMIESEKQRLRDRMRKLAPLHGEADSSLIRDCLLGHAAWNGTSSVLLFSPISGEPDLLPLLSNQGKKRFFFPRIEGEHLGIYCYGEKSRWVIGPFGLSEPDPETWAAASLGEIDLALVPGLAFDNDGGRLGRGRGFYDRLMRCKSFNGVKIGLCWEWQIVPKVPRNHLDVLMDLVIAGGKIHSPGSLLDKSRERR